MDPLWLLPALVIGLVIGNKKPVVRTDDDRYDFLRIRCPACQWQPGKDDRWACNPGCGHLWNTFLTNGQCPGCDRQWRETACVRCGVWSPHGDWYEGRRD